MIDGHTIVGGAACYLISNKPLYLMKNHAWDPLRPAPLHCYSYVLAHMHAAARPKFAKPLMTPDQTSMVQWERSYEAPRFSSRPHQRGEDAH